MNAVLFPHPPLSQPKRLHQEIDCTHHYHHTIGTECEKKLKKNKTDTTYFEKRVLLCCPDWPGTDHVAKSGWNLKSTCPCLLNTWVIGMCHQIQPQLPGVDLTGCYSRISCFILMFLASFIAWLVLLNWNMVSYNPGYLRNIYVS